MTKTFSFSILFFALMGALFVPASAQELRVAAAADLTKAFSEVGSSFQRKTGKKVTLIFGASGMLSKQIENGAPYDLFAAANERYINDLEQKGLMLPGTKVIYGQGHIGLWTRKNGPPVPADIKSLALAQYAKIALANPQFAPYGQAAKEALQAEHLWDRLQSRFVYGENIQQTFQFAASGNADVGIVSQSLAAGGGGQFRAIPDTLYKPLKQALAVLKTTKQEATAKQFAAYVTGQEGQAILKKYGLALPESKIQQTKGNPKR